MTPVRARAQSEESDMLEPPYQRTLFRDDVSGDYEHEDSEDEEDEDAPVFHPAVQERRVKMTYALEVLGKVLSYLWLLLPFGCLFVAFLFPQYLVGVIQSPAGSLTSENHGHAQAIASIQVHLDAMINDMDGIKKIQRQQDAKMDELLFLHEHTSRTVERLADGERIAAGNVPSSVWNHMEEMVQTAVKKNVRELKAELKSLFNSLELSIMDLSSQSTLLEKDVKAQKDRLNTMDSIFDSTPSAELITLLEKRIQDGVAKMKDDLVQLVKMESERLMKESEEKIAKIKGELDPQVTPQDFYDGAINRVDYANKANGAVVVYYKSSFFKWSLQSFLMNFMASTQYTSKSYHAFPMCSILGDACPSFNYVPETAISSNVDIGNCWGFAGSSGMLTIKFRSPILADTLQLYHIKPNIASDFSSAPRMIQVTGLVSTIDRLSSVELGTFEYSKNGRPYQHFALHPEAASTLLDGIIFRVLSNHGNPKYTCVYRVSVFGQEPSINSSTSTYSLKWTSTWWVNTTSYKLTCMPNNNTVQLLTGQEKIIPLLLREKRALQDLRHTNIVDCYGTFQTRNQIHFVLEYVPGGELFKCDDEAKFYAMELLLILEHIHANDYIYRDLKPENILFDANGHLKLVDFGFAKPDMDIEKRSFTSIGTPQYLTPEQPKPQNGYTRAVD
ncbi:hypothetical protein THRCLA_07342 [Thraustotheca clavata]|uniref:Protein kinase domain-containing protein n=1 Tax=Thraustotheca clavata TaxID=74557 RepID=A0A1V9ZEF8_9STRA|nr:hypothetical protein THRCLA_07342 [Thraustotheca clavata]